MDIPVYIGQLFIYFE